MRKLKRSNDKSIYCIISNKELVLSVAIIFLVILCFNLVVHPHFETNDDVAILNLLYGVNGRISHNLIFINVVVGYFLEGLLNLFPNLPWYSIVQYGIIAVSSIIIVYLLLKKFKGTSSIIPVSIFILFFAYDYFVSVQFTKTAGISTIAGILLILYSGVNERLLGIIIGSVMTIIGSLYRFDSFGMSGLLMSICIVYVLYELYQKNERTKIIKILITFAIVGVMCLIFMLINKNHYNNDSEWASYIRFNKLRAQVTDYGYPDYNEYKEIYNDLGIKKKDLNMYQKWDIADPDLYTTENLEVLVKYKDKLVLDKDLVFDYFRLALGHLKNRWYLGALMFGLLIYSHSLYKTKRQFVLVVLELLSIAVIILYLYLRGRYKLNRIDVQIILAPFLGIMLYGINDITFISKKVLTMVVLVVVVGTILNALMRVDSFKKKDKEVKYANKITEYISNNKDCIYLMATTADRVNYNFWNKPETSSRSNLYKLGGWTTNYPYCLDMLEKYDIKNPFRDSVDRQDVFVITKNDDGKKINEYTKYIKRHYNEKASNELVDVVSDYYAIYRINTRME